MRSRHLYSRSVVRWEFLAVVAEDTVVGEPMRSRIRLSFPRHLSGPDVCGNSIANIEKAFGKLFNIVK